MPKITFGKYAGLDLQDVPQDYIEWVLQKNKDQTAEYEAELDRRAALLQASETLVQKIVNTGYKTLAKTMHPDQGGTDKQMHDLTMAKAWLDDKIKEK
jgi:hypothetical protein